MRKSPSPRPVPGLLGGREPYVPQEVKRLLAPRPGGSERPSSIGDAVVRWLEQEA